MPGGRPTEYTPEIVEKAKFYLATCVDDLTQKVVKLPKLESLGLFLHISRETVYDWAKKYPEFSDIVDEILQSQAERLLDNGLVGTYNPTIAKLILSKHGYKEKTDITTDDKPLTYTITKFDGDKIPPQLDTGNPPTTNP